LLAWLDLQNKFKKLSLQKKWNSGRNDSGHKVIRTKSSFLKKNKLIKINYNFNYIKLGTIMSFHFIPFKNKFLSLIYFSNGAVTYHLTNESMKNFFIYFLSKI